MWSIIQMEEQFYFLPGSSFPAENILLHSKLNGYIDSFTVLHQIYRQII